MNEQCLCLLDSKKDDKVAAPVCAQERERYYLDSHIGRSSLTSPSPNSPRTPPKA